MALEPSLVSDISGWEMLQISELVLKINVNFPVRRLQMLCTIFRASHWLLLMFHSV
jgi:hypothetical protein